MLVEDSQNSIPGFLNITPDLVSRHLPFCYEFLGPSLQTENAEDNLGEINRNCYGEQEIVWYEKETISRKKVSEKSGEDSGSKF